MSPQKPPTILLVEDDEADVVLTREAFSESQYEVALEVVSDGEAAITYLAATKDGAPQRPDLILLDLNLPKVSGKEFLDQVKQDPDLRRIPVVVLSTSDASTDRADAYDRGANSYLTKMTDFSTFVSTMGELAEYWFGVNRPAPD